MFQSPSGDSFVLTAVMVGFEPSKMFQSPSGDSFVLTLLEGGADINARGFNPLAGILLC